MKSFSNRITFSQRRKHTEETFEAEMSEDNHISDSDKEESFQPSDAAVSDSDNASNNHFCLLLCKSITIMFYKLCIFSEMTY